jgi:hypothetical protein
VSWRTEPAFIFGPGRCGTKLIQEVFESVFWDLEIHHEYRCVDVAKLTCDKAVGRNVQEGVKRIYKPAIHYSDKSHWIDCSNKTSFLLDDLKVIWPQSRFVYLMRDPRKVVASYFNKLYPEVYTDKGRKVLWKYYKQGDPEPPMEKQYWWPLFAHKDTNQWWSIISYVKEVHMCWISAKRDYPNNVMAVRLEDLVGDGGGRLQGMLDFLGLQSIPMSNQAIYEMLQTPVNVHEPFNPTLAEEDLDDIRFSMGSAFKDFYNLDIPPKDVDYDKGKK